MEKINFQKISDSNNCFRIMNQICFLKYIKLKKKIDTKQEINKCFIEQLQFFEFNNKDDKSFENEDNTLKLMYHKLWNKLAKIHKINRIQKYINELKNIDQKNSTILFKHIIDKLFNDKIFNATNSTVKKNTKKKNKYTIDYDPINGIIVHIEGIYYSDTKKKYLTRF